MTDFSNIHALIIENDKLSVDVLKGLLNHLQINSTSLLDSTRINEVLHHLPKVDIFFVDLQMPGYDGYKILEIIRADSVYRHTPVVAYTAHTNEMATARSKGFHSFLGKPLHSAEFAKQLESILQNEHVWVIN